MCERNHPAPWTCGLHDGTDGSNDETPLLIVFLLITDPTEVYTWGNNTNFSLGHGNQESRQNPELVDVFARNGVYIKQVG